MEHQHGRFRKLRYLCWFLYKDLCNLAITGSLRAFDLVYVMTGGGPNHISEVPATLMYNNLFRKRIYMVMEVLSIFIVIECLNIYIYCKQIV